MKYDPDIVVSENLREIFEMSYEPTKGITPEKSVICAVSAKESIDIYDRTELAATVVKAMHKLSTLKLVNKSAYR